jgi:hypothetical protein
MSDKPLMTQTLNLIDNFIRRTTMMTIKDLSASKELDRKALAEVRGGQTISVATGNSGNQVIGSANGGNLFSPNSNLTFGVQEQTATSVVSAAEVNSFLPYGYGW